MKNLVVTREVDDEELAELRRPRDHFVEERALGPDHFGLEVGPFSTWDRTLRVEPAGDGRHRVTTTIAFRLAVTPWGWAIAPFVRHNLRRTGGRGEQTWWMPARLDARSAAVIGILALFSALTGYLGVLIGQTNAFFRAEFGASSSEVADVQILVRVGAFAAFATAALADRWGRRRTLLLSSVLGIVLAATSALAPNLWGITITQGAARAFSSAMIVILAVMAAEEVPARARASAQSLLALTAGMGAGAMVGLLWIAGLSPGAWRFLYVVPLPLLAVLPALARRLPETRRFEVYDLEREPAPAGEPGPGRPHDRRGFWRNLVLVGAMLLLFNLFIIPFGGFTNDFLLTERDFSAWQLTLFQILTGLPGGASIVVGGLLADRYGRKLIGTIGLVGGTVTGVASFFSAGWPLWAFATAAIVLGALLVPTVLVYPTELFPTARRGRAQGYATLAAVAGSATGLKVTGVLADRWGTYALPIALLGIGPVLAAVIVVLFFPETTGIELEELNPGDVPPPRGDELVALDRRWEERREHGQRLAVHERDDPGSGGHGDAPLDERIDR